MISQFSYTMIKYKFDIVALSKTWIKIIKLDYVQIGCYISEFKNRESKYQDGVSFYIRHDYGKIYEPIEIIWIEIQGRNKNSPVFIVVVY